MLVQTKLQSEITNHIHTHIFEEDNCIMASQWGELFKPFLEHSQWEMKLIAKQNLPFVTP